MALSGSCHCGVVQIRISGPLPDDLNDCQCEHCQKRGALWAYYDAGQVSITGVTSSYEWGDRELTFHFCSNCGMTTHWSAIDTTYGRLGVNARVLGRDVFQRIPIRKGMPS
jgi:hypothetical protein